MIENETTEVLQAAENNDPEAQFQLATSAMNAGEKEKFLKWINLAVQNGHPFAITNLGICYYFGDFVEQSYDKAFELFVKSSELGDPNANYYLGLSYLNGLGLSIDTTKGFYLLLNTANEGMPWAQLEVAKCYEVGKGIGEDLFEAVSWYYRAADQGVEEAGEKFNQLYYSNSFVDANGNQRFFPFELETLKD
jgi:TPR repeat protein